MRFAVTLALDGSGARVSIRGADAPAAVHLGRSDAHRRGDVQNVELVRGLACWLVS